MPVNIGLAHADHTLDMKNLQFCDFGCIICQLMDQEVKQLEEERGLPRILLSVFVGILVVVALVLVGGRVIQNRIKSDQQKTVPASTSSTPSSSAG